MISFRNISKKFGKLEVLKNLDLEIESSGVYAILGPNGSGKTTLIKALLGMVIPEKGEILLNNAPVLGTVNYRNEIDYLPQIAMFPNNLAVSELISLMKQLRAKKTVDFALVELFGLKESLNKKLGNLSGGTRQKVNLVLALMFDSPLIILDEPTSGLDPISLIHLKEIIQTKKKQNKTILISSHIMSFVEEVADEIVFLLEGKIYFKGRIHELKETTNQNDLEHAMAAILKESDD